jgi:hypothetical protein
MQQNNLLERRKHKRYQVEESVLVFNSTTFGQIINISEGGLSFRYLAQKGDPPLSSFEIGILNGDNGFYLDKLSCRTVTVNDTPPIHPTSSTIIRRTGIQFTDLTSEQNERLANFLIQNATGEAISSLTH